MKKVKKSDADLHVLQVGATGYRLLIVGPLIEVASHLIGFQNIDKGMGIDFMDLSSHFFYLITSYH